MKRYAGDADDPTIGGGSFTETAPGGERYNFKVVNGKMYGRFQPKRASGGFSLDRIVADARGETLLKNVCVVFVATKPGGGQCVVGWYADGVVYATERPPGEKQRADCEWNIRGTAAKAVLLPVDRRTWDVPTGEGGMGQTHVRYPLGENHQPEIQPWMTAILKKVAAYDGPNLVNATTTDEEVLEGLSKALAKTGHPGFLADAAARRAVEMRAMRKAIAHFGGSTVVTDDHNGNPYDLSLLVDGKKKYVEVKGTTGAGEEVLLTSGEVNWSRQNPCALYVLRDIKLAKVDGKWKATGGKAEIVDPWVPADADLHALAFSYRV
ncbi:MAG: DUF3883 domain-containing protein [Myxococcota bacterium]